MDGKSLGVSLMLRIALVGPSGVGKTTVGEALSRRLKIAFADLDAVITTAAGRTVPVLFADEGEIAFRVLEKQALEDMTKNRSDRLVLATGGGVVTTAGCREILRRDWFCIGLTGSADTLLQRLQTEFSGRPLLNGEVDLETRIQMLLEQRQTWYDAVSQMQIAVDGKPVRDVVEEIVQALDPDVNGAQPEG